MLKSVAKQHKEILELLKQKEQEHRIEGIQVEVLDTIGEFLSSLKKHQMIWRVNATQRSTMSCCGSVS